METLKQKFQKSEFKLKVPTSITIKGEKFVLFTNAVRDLKGNFSKQRIVFQGLTYYKQ